MSNHTDWQNLRFRVQRIFPLADLTVFKATAWRLEELDDLKELTVLGVVMIAASVSPSVVLQCPPRLSPSSKGLTAPIDLKRIENAVREILLARGEDPDRDGLIDTPKRVAKSYRELFRGLAENPSMHLSRTFRHEHNGIVILRDIEFFSICEHHPLSFVGKAHIAYLPTGGRAVELLSRCGSRARNCPEGHRGHRR